MGEAPASSLWYGLVCGIQTVVLVRPSHPAADDEPLRNGDHATEGGTMRGERMDRRGFLARMPGLVGIGTASLAAVGCGGEDDD